MATVKKQNSTVGDGDPLRRLLAMDGGGIYGLFSVLMLKALCAENSRFLKKGDVRVFAGTSAGALSALSLAAEEDPRSIVQSGQLEELFEDPRLYGIKPGLKRMMGTLGMTAWTGARDSESLMREKFGEMTLGDLPNKVVVCTFDLFGDPDMEGQQKWRPRMYHNLKGQKQSVLDMPVWKLAFGATAPVGWRSVRHGITDGGLFADNPILPSIATLLQAEKWHAREEDGEHLLCETLPEDYACLANFRLLSLGVGNKIPHYQWRNFDLGYLSFNLLPTNMKDKFYWPPLWHLMLEPGVEGATEQAYAFLGESHFHRLDPGVLGYPIPPVLGAMYLCKYNSWRDFIAKNIRKGMNDKLTRLEIQQTLDWLSVQWHPTPEALDAPPKTVAAE
jgi:hypothetical protein